MLVWSSMTSIVAFAILLAAAIVLRRRPETHKRLMLLASISIIQFAIGRIFRWPLFDAAGSEGLIPPWSLRSPWSSDRGGRLAVVHWGRRTHPLRLEIDGCP